MIWFIYALCQKKTIKNFYLNPIKVRQISAQFGTVAYSNQPTIYIATNHEAPKSANDAVNLPRNQNNTQFYSELLQKNVTEMTYAKAVKSLNHQNLYEEGIALMEEATEHFPQSSQLLKHLGILLSKAHRHDSALATLDQAKQYAISDKEVQKIQYAVWDAQLREKRTPDIENKSGWGSLKY